MSRALTIINILDRMRKDVPDRPLRIVETGMVRSLKDEYHEGDGWSTLYLSRWTRDNGSVFISLDMDPGAVRAARNLLHDNGLEEGPDITLLCGPSHEVLQTLDGPWDLIYLDTADDPDNTVNEFNLLRNGIKDTIVIVDDSSLDISTPGVNKARKLVGVAAREGVPMFQVGRHVILAFGGSLEWVVPGA